MFLARSMFSAEAAPNFLHLFESLRIQTHIEVRITDDLPDRRLHQWEMLEFPGNAAGRAVHGLAHRQLPIGLDVRAGLIIEVRLPQQIHVQKIAHRSGGGRLVVGATFFGQRLVPFADRLRFGRDGAIPFLRSVMLRAQHTIAIFGGCLLCGLGEVAIAPRLQFRTAGTDCLRRTGRHPR